jgi:hypothetical protein
VPYQRTPEELAVVVDLLEASAGRRLQSRVQMLLLVVLEVVAEYSYRGQESTGHLEVPSV